ncbi:hypothetical protein C8A00DRAFT_11059 [Chaetomidium leptoderma]|uniref:DUF3824 domain-containing protein n=1 Tax=Chaetomidium leptoderma TaxID=669021 RepID=A0AAN6VX65_9PEZI|nr:hypothetical protein C8A00DRAFT_11059 [Chaetomidium leptoderma]
MASYDPYDAPPRERTHTKRYYREERRDDRDPRYFETRESLHVQPSRDLVPRAREDSDLSVEEIRRDFPPPGYSSRDLRRARSAEPGYHDEYDDRRSHYSRDRDYDDYDRKARKKTDVAYYEEEQKKARMLSKQEQIIAAVTGAALAIGGKEVYDRRDANQHGTDVQRNLLASAALGAAGALAGYQGTEFYNKHKEKEEKKAIAHRSGYYSDDNEGSKEKKGNKNFLESALAAAGLGGAVKALTGGKDDKSDTRSRRDSRSRSRSRSTSRSRGKDKDKGGKGDGASRVQKAAMASLIAGATEAFRVSKQPGSWKGEKAKRIITVAAGAATLDAAQDSDKAGSKLGLAEAVVGGLLGNRVLNGSKKNIEMDEKTGRSRSRSRARSKDTGGGGGGGVSGLAALATAGLGAFGAKKLMDNNHQRSRSRRRSADSRDSRDGSPDRRHRSRSRSVVDSARRRLAKVGIGNGPDDDDRDRRDRSRDRSRDRRRDQDDYGDSGRSRRHRDDHDDHDRDRRRRDDHDDDRSHRSGGRDRSRQGRRGSVSSDDLGDSDDDKKRGKKLRGKQVITTGLAAVATIHAAHSVYQSMEKRHVRQKAVKEGKISAEQAEKLKNKAILQDAAAVGIAALGIKGAISEVKEANELRHELRQFRLEEQERHKRRLERRRSRSLAHGGVGGGGTDQLGRRRADYWDSAAPPGADRYDDGPRYVDGNPYGAMLPAGPSDRR